MFRATRRWVALQSGASSDGREADHYKRPIKPVYIRKLIAFIDVVSNNP
jgi:hypothetical protein